MRPFNKHKINICRWVGTGEVYRINETGTYTSATCDECGKLLTSDDAYGHDCEVF